MAKKKKKSDDVGERIAWALERIAMALHRPMDSEELLKWYGPFYVDLHFITEYFPELRRLKTQNSWLKELVGSQGIQRAQEGNGIEIQRWLMQQRGIPLPLMPDAELPPGVTPKRTKSSRRTQRPPRKSPKNHS